MFVTGRFTTCMHTSAAQAGLLGPSLQARHAMQAAEEPEYVKIVKAFEELAGHFSQAVERLQAQGTASFFGPGVREKYGLALLYGE